MQELTFETILRLPQMELKKRLKAELKSRGYPVTDKPGYLVTIDIYMTMSKA